MEEKPKKRRRNDDRPSVDDWATRDRAFIIEQAQNVADAFGIAFEILNDDQDDEQAFAVIARALQQIPPICNPVVDETNRLREQQQRECNVSAALDMRRTANKVLAELVVAASGGGNVIQFPRQRA